jgi:uncharacterized protein (DUF2384 family)
MSSIREKAIELFGLEVADIWLNTPNMALAGLAPVQSAEQVVETLLKRIEYGDYS